MAIVTKVMLEAENVGLRAYVTQQRAELMLERDKANLYKTQFDLLSRHTSTMTIAVERISDAMSHAIGFVTDPKRRLPKPDLRTFADLHEVDKRE